MDQELTPTPSTSTKSDTDIDSPPHTTQSIINPNPLPFTNGGLLKNHHHHWGPPPSAVVLVTYKECMKNHAAALGGHAVDGCGEFMPISTTTDPASLKCAACGCHRNFHRREPDFPTATAVITPQFLDFRHPTNLPKGLSLSPSPPPPPINSYGPPPNNMLFTLSTVAAAEDHHREPATPTAENPPAGRKRFRTKFSQEQKEKMQSFSEKLGWKMPRRDDPAVQEFCKEIGVSKGVLKVWMHNNKNKKDHVNGGINHIINGTTTIGGAGLISCFEHENDYNNNNGDMRLKSDHGDRKINYENIRNGGGSHFQNGNSSGGGVHCHGGGSNNGSSSST